MSAVARLKLPQTSLGSPPAWCAHDGRIEAAQIEGADAKQDFSGQSKGLVGGVPLNTERAAVKPRAGIE